MPRYAAICTPRSRIRSSGTFQTPMPLAEKPARRWKRIAATRRRPPPPGRRPAARAAALARRLQAPQALVLRAAEPLGGGRVGLWEDRHRPLRGPDRLDVLVGELDRLELGRGDDRAGGGQRVGALLHLEVHPDLEQ